MAQKLQSYLVATEYFLGHRIIQNVDSNCDTYTTLLKLCPYLSKFLLKTLDESIDPLRLSAIRGLEFLIEYLGCTINLHLPLILKQIVLTYPQSQGTIGSEQNYNDTLSSQNEQSSSNRAQQLQHAHQQHAFGSQSHLNTQQSAQQRVMFDMYHRLLDSFLNLLASASSQILKSIFNDVILHQIFSVELNTDLRLYLLKISEKIISICQGDLQVTPGFITSVVQLVQHSQSEASQLVRQNVAILWENMKQKLIINLDVANLNKLIEVLVEGIYQAAEQENSSQQQQNQHAGHLQHFSQQQGRTSGAGSTFEYLIELIAIIVSRDKRPQQSLPPNYAKYQRKLEQSEELLNARLLIKPLVVWIDVILQNPTKLEDFKRAWTVLVDIINTLPKPQETTQEIAIPILGRVLKYMESASPSQTMLNFLIASAVSRKCRVGMPVCACVCWVRSCVCQLGITHDGTYARPARL